MSLVTNDTLKTYFVTGAKPTQQQFVDLIDSLRNAGVKILEADLDPTLIALLAGLPSASTVTEMNTELQSLLPITATTPLAQVVVPAGKWITAILIVAPTEVTLSVGETPGGADVVPATDITDGALSYQIYKRFSTDTTLYITGAAPDTTLKILVA